jgi:hypothetical protein
VFSDRVISPREDGLEAGFEAGPVIDLPPWHYGMCLQRRKLISLPSSYYLSKHLDAGAHVFQLMALDSLDASAVYLTGAQPSTVS